MTPTNVVTWGSLICGGLCFLLYLLLSLAPVFSKSAPAKTVNSRAAGFLANPAASVEDVTKLIEALSKLTDSLAKAGPALTSLVGALLFFLIAALNSGAFRGADCPAPAPAKAGVSSPHVSGAAPGTATP